MNESVRDCHDGLVSSPGVASTSSEWSPAPVQG